MPHLNLCHNHHKQPYTTTILYNHATLNTEPYIQLQDFKCLFCCHKASNWRCCDTSKTSETIDSQCSRQSILGEELSLCTKSGTAKIAQVLHSAMIKYRPWAACLTLWADNIWADMKFTCSHANNITFNISFTCTDIRRHKRCQSVPYTLIVQICHNALWSWHKSVCTNVNNLNFDFSVDLVKTNMNTLNSTNTWFDHVIKLRMLHMIWSCDQVMYATHDLIMWSSYVCYTWFDHVIKSRTLHIIWSCDPITYDLIMWSSHVCYTWFIMWSSHVWFDHVIKLRMLHMIWSMWSSYTCYHMIWSCDQVTLCYTWFDHVIMLRMLHMIWSCDQVTYATHDLIMWSSYVCYTWFDHVIKSHTLHIIWSCDPITYDLVMWSSHVWYTWLIHVIQVAYDLIMWSSHVWNTHDWWDWWCDQVTYATHDLITWLNHMFIWDEMKEGPVCCTWPAHFSWLSASLSLCPRCRASLQTLSMSSRTLQSPATASQTRLNPC